ncbi:MAG: thioesterase [Gammaproteobacteria bacterium]|nr:thioesterase [Gammaproteobacteria bacterium]
MATAPLRSPVFIRSPNPAAKLRLFCFPYAGAGAAVYRQWPEWLPADIEVAAVQLPGREWRIKEPPLEDLHALALDALDAIRDKLDKPFALLGTSLGGGLIFELARVLRSEGLPAPVCLIPLAVGAPHTPEEKLYHMMADDELIAELSEFGVMSDEFTGNDELLELALPILRADCVAHETYPYEEQPPFTFPIWVYGGTGDDSVTRERLEAWSVHTTGECQVHMLPGGHLFVDDMPDMLLQSIVRRLFQSLQRTQ